MIPTPFILVIIMKIAGGAWVGAHLPASDFVDCTRQLTEALNKDHPLISGYGKGKCVPTHGETPDVVAARVRAQLMLDMVD